jgi:hypothetical protein
MKSICMFLSICMYFKAMQDIERKQWLARKNQADSEQRYLEIKQAQDKACKK